MHRIVPKDAPSLCTVSLSLHLRLVTDHQTIADVNSQLRILSWRELRERLDFCMGQVEGE